MDFALSSRLFVGERLNSHVLDQVLAAGIRQIEIFAARQHLDYYDKNQVRDLAECRVPPGLEEGENDLAPGIHGSHRTSFSTSTLK